MGGHDGSNKRSFIRASGTEHSVRVLFSDQVGAMSLSGSTALVMGAAQGLGAALADALLRRGAKVALLDILEEEVKSKAAELEQLYGAGRTLAIHCDVTSTDFEKSFEKVKEHFGSLTIVINNAGIMNEQEWEKMISINLLAVINGTKLAMKHMEKDGGVVVNVSSVVGLEAFSFCPVYTASKHGVLGFSRALAAINKEQGVKVRVNVLCPSVMDTPLLQTAFTPERLGSTFDILPIVHQLIGDEKLEPRTVAEACMRLVEDKSLNGSALKVVASMETELVQFPKILSK